MSKKHFIFTEPMMEFKDTYIEGIKDFQKEGIRYLTENIEDLTHNFEGYIEKWNKESKGIDLEPGRVPQTVYWMIVGGKYVGRVYIRHILNENLLKTGGHIGYDVIPSERKKGYGTTMFRYALEKAKERGLEKVLITCDENNVPSRMMIEHAGGVLENIVPQLEHKPAKCRFWIALQ